jgi:hypothetical protein
MTLEEMKEKGLKGVLDLSTLTTGDIDELEERNPLFMFREDKDYEADGDPLHGYYAVLKSDRGWCANDWHIKCTSGNPEGFSFDLEGEDYDSFRSYINYLMMKRDGEI